MKKFKGQVYRDAINTLREGYACLSKAIQDKTESYSDRFSLLFSGNTYCGWSFTKHYKTKKIEPAYATYTELGRRTREIALELAAHLEDIGEMDKILKGK